MGGAQHGAGADAMPVPSAGAHLGVYGDLVRKVPLFAALRAGRLGGAGQDVVEGQPLRTREEAGRPNLIVTCRAAFCSWEGMIEMRTASARPARAAVLGEPGWKRVN